MAPLPVNGTPRFKVHYTSLGKSHVMDVRGSSALSPAGLGTAVDNLLIPLGSSSLIYTITINDVEFSASGSNVFNPVTTGIEGNTYGIMGGGTADIPRFLNFIGRSVDGRRVRLAVYSTVNVATDYRYLAGENAGVDAAIANLTASTNAFRSISGQLTVWKSYANVGVSAYWQRKIRP